MIKRKKYKAKWVKHLPADHDDGKDYCVVEHDSYDLADFHASHCAQNGPEPDYWEVVELIMKGAHRLGKPDNWLVTRRWVSGQEQCLEI